MKLRTGCLHLKGGCKMYACRVWKRWGRVLMDLGLFLIYHVHICLFSSLSWILLLHFPQNFFAFYKALSLSLSLPLCVCVCCVCGGVLKCNILRLSFITLSKSVCSVLLCVYVCYLIWFCWKREKEEKRKQGSLSIASQRKKTTMMECILTF